MSGGGGQRTGDAGIEQRGDRADIQQAGGEANRAGGRIGGVDAHRVFIGDGRSERECIACAGGDDGVGGIEYAPCGEESRGNRCALKQAGEVYRSINGSDDRRDDAQSERKGSGAHTQRHRRHAVCARTIRTRELDGVVAGLRDCERDAFAAAGEHRRICGIQNAPRGGLARALGDECPQLPGGCFKEAGHSRAKGRRCCTHDERRRGRGDERAARTIGHAELNGECSGCRGNVDKLASGGDHCRAVDSPVLRERRCRGIRREREEKLLAGQRNHRTGDRKRADIRHRGRRAGNGHFQRRCADRSRHGIDDLEAHGVCAICRRHPCEVAARVRGDLCAGAVFHHPRRRVIAGECSAVEQAAKDKRLAGGTGHRTADAGVDADFRLRDTQSCERGSGDAGPDIAHREIHPEITNDIRNPRKVRSDARCDHIAGSIPHNPRCFVFHAGSDAVCERGETDRLSAAPCCRTVDARGECDDRCSNGQCGRGDTECSGNRIHELQLHAVFTRKRRHEDKLSARARGDDAVLVVEHRPGCLHICRDICTSELRLISEQDAANALRRSGDYGRERIGCCGDDQILGHHNDRAGDRICHGELNAEIACD